MQLRVARLCLDCDEVHDAPACPVCGSEAFGYLTRWVPAPERRMRPRPTTSPEAEVYRELMTPDAVRPASGRLLKGSALGVALVAAAGWLWRRQNATRRDEAAGAPPESPDGGGTPAD
jgi:hypothetical protein